MDKSGIRSCYEKELKKDRTLQGHLTAQFEIDLDGTVKTARILKDTVDNHTVRSCVIGRLKRLKFDAPEGGTVLVSYPFEFRQKTQ